MVDFVVRVIMIDYIFIQTNKMMPKGHKFICTSKTFFATTVRVGHLDFGIKKKLFIQIFLTLLNIIML
jgi:hypothetical protein